MPLSQRPLSQREAEIRELVVEALSRLISANPESGVKHSLSMAYDPDPRQRLIFSYVFARVMGQGAKFEAQETPVSFSGRSRLCEVRLNIDRKNTRPFLHFLYS